MYGKPQHDQPDLKAWAPARSQHASQEVDLRFAPTSSSQSSSSAQRPQRPTSRQISQRGIGHLNDSSEKQQKNQEVDLRGTFNSNNSNNIHYTVNNGGNENGSGMESMMHAIPFSSLAPSTTSPQNIFTVHESTNEPDLRGRPSFTPEDTSPRVATTKTTSTRRAHRHSRKELNDKLNLAAGGSSRRVSEGNLTTAAVNSKDGSVEAVLLSNADNSNVDLRHSRIVDSGGVVAARDDSNMMDAKFQTRRRRIQPRRSGDKNTEEIATKLQYDKQLGDDPSQPHAPTRAETKPGAVRVDNSLNKYDSNGAVDGINLKSNHIADGSHNAEKDPGTLVWFSTMKSTTTTTTSPKDSDKKYHSDNNNNKYVHDLRASSAEKSIQNQDDPLSAKLVSTVSNLRPNPNPQELGERTIRAMPVVISESIPERAESPIPNALVGSSSSLDVVAVAVVATPVTVNEDNTNIPPSSSPVSPTPKQKNKKKAGQKTQQQQQRRDRGGGIGGALASIFSRRKKGS